MTPATTVSEEEYLATSYRPDRELLDGELVERNSGEFDHSNLQAGITIWIGNRQREWNVRVLPEQRIRVRPKQYRVPDICIVFRRQEIEPVFASPPLVCIEILSRNDSLRSIQDRIDDYVNLGVPNIWVLEPIRRRAYACSRHGFQEPECRELSAPGTEIRIPLDEIFADLD